MKKLLIFLILSFFPWRGEAIVCDPPLVCIKKESQVCVEQNMIHLGDDDCVECGCPDGGDFGKDGKTCCKNGNTWSTFYKSYPNSLFNIEVCGCPEEGEEKIDDFNEKICCKDQKKWDIIDEKYQAIDLTCGCPDELKKQIDGKELCCKNEIPDRSPVCPPEKGVPIMVDRNELLCGCGCRSDDDCNTDHSWYQFWRKKRICSLAPDWKCIRNFGCYKFDNLSVVLEERDDLELQPEDLPSLVEKLKSQMGLESDEHVKLVINSYSCPKVGLGVKGFVSNGDATTIVIDINHCCEISEGEWSCEGTVLHENEHHQDNYKQPVWSDLKSTIAKAYADNLTEINAHAKGDIKTMTQRYRLCYPETNNFQNICKTAPESDQCKKCAMLYVPSYLKDFDNPEYAKKYHDDPDYFDPDGGCKGQSYNTCQCRGIRLEFERKYINSSFAKSSYIAGQAIKNAMCGDAAEEAAQKDLRNIIEALAECEGWDKPPEEDLTDLPKLIAQLYKEKNELCMPAEEIASNVNIAQGLEGLQTCSVIKDFLTANANVDLNNLPTTCEEKCEEVTLTSD